MSMEIFGAGIGSQCFVLENLIVIQKILASSELPPKSI